MNKSKIHKSIQEIFTLYKKRKVIRAFTLESVQDILEIGNEVFLRHNPEEAERLANRPRTQAPDLFDDEPFSFERTFEIYKRLSDEFGEVNPELIQRVFEVNSQLAWEAYREKYNQYIMDIYPNHPEDEYINYLATVVLLEEKKHDDALKCINRALVQNSTSANYTHLKGMCLMQLGEFETSRTYLYQSLFLVELMQDTPPKMEGNKELYPNHPIEFQTSAPLIRADLKKLDRIETIYNYELRPLLG